MEPRAEVAVKVCEVIEAVAAWGKEAVADGKISRSEMFNLVMKIMAVAQ